MAKEKIFETDEDALIKLLERGDTWWNAFVESQQPKRLSLEELLMAPDDTEEIKKAEESFVLKRPEKKKHKKTKKEIKEKKLRKKMEKDALNRAINTMTNGAAITFNALKNVTPEESYYGHVELFQNFLLKSACIMNGIPVYKYKQGIGYKKTLSPGFCRIRHADMSFIFEESNLNWGDISEMSEVDIDSDEFKYRYLTLLISNTINRIYNVTMNKVYGCDNDELFIRAGEELKKLRINYKKLIYAVVDGNIPYSVRMARIIEDFGYLGVPHKTYPSSLGHMKVYDRNCYITTEFAEIKYRCMHDISMVMDDNQGDLVMYQLFKYAYQMATDDFKAKNCKKIYGKLEGKIYTDDVPDAVKELGKAIRKQWNFNRCDTLNKIPPVASAFYGSNVKIGTDYEAFVSDTNYICGYKALLMMKFIFKDSNVNRVVDMILTHCPDKAARYAEFTL